MYTDRVKTGLVSRDENWLCNYCESDYRKLGSVQGTVDMSAGLYKCSSSVRGCVASTPKRKLCRLKKWPHSWFRLMDKIVENVASLSKVKDPGI